MVIFLFKGNKNINGYMLKINFLAGINIWRYLFIPKQKRISQAHMATNCVFLPAISNIAHSSRSSSATVIRSSLTAVSAKRHLLNLISDQERGLKTQSNPQKLSQIVDAIDSLAAIGRGTVTTDKSLSATWRLLWTTEKEQLFIIKNAPFFGSAAGDVLQVIDVEKKTLNNVITFPPDGVFFVRSDIQVESDQRVNFQ